MKLKVAMVIVGLAFAARSASATGADPKNLKIYNDISSAVNRYSEFTIFDDVSSQIQNGVVTLSGQVTMPYKRTDIEKRVAKVNGVNTVVNNITVLPVSGWDNQLRYRIARAIYRNSNFTNYGIGPNPSIHIIVEHGNVTLTGVVMNDMDRMMARSLVTQFGVMSVTNKLQTDAEVREALEKS